jgi:protein involved in ribonucleotide reduction
MKKLFLFIGIIGILSTVSFAKNKKTDKEAAGKAQFEKALAAKDAKDYVIIVDAYESRDRTSQTNTDLVNFLSYEKEFAYLHGVV